MTIAVFGATGHLGGLVVEHLLARGVPPAELVALGRNPDRLAELEDLGVRVAHAEMSEPDTLAAALEGVDTVLLISGNEVGQRVTQHGNVIAAAEGAGAGRLVYTSVLRASTTELLLAPEHAATEELLAAAGLATSVLRNGWYTENYRPAVDGARQTGEIASSVGDGRVASASRADFAEATAVVLTEDGHDGAIYELTGDVAWSFHDLADAASQALDRPVTYRPLSPEEETEALLTAGLDEATAGFVVGLNGNIRDGLLAETPGDLSRLLGRPTTPLAESVRSWV